MSGYLELSEELQQRIITDRKNHWVSSYKFQDEKLVTRRHGHHESDLWRPVFVKESEKIMNIPYYNRYSDKTQVFSLVKNDDISRRAQHVQLVSRIARNIGRLLGLNTDLIEAISLGHDIGHTPFGHAGEKQLDQLYYGHTGRHFYHNIQSARVLDRIFPLNLSLQTLDGIICHNGESEQKIYRPKAYTDFKTYDAKVEHCYLEAGADKQLVPATLEACVMRVSDIIAYLGKDRQDAIKLGLIPDDTEFEESKIGKTNAEIINNMIVNIVENSYGKDYLTMDDDYFEAFSIGKRENYKFIYKNDKVSEVYRTQINPMIEQIYEKLLSDLKVGNQSSVIYTHHIDYVREQAKHYAPNPDFGPYEESNPNDLVVDYIASMTDDYFVDLYKYLFPDGVYKVEYQGYFEKTEQ